MDYQGIEVETEATLAPGITSEIIHAWLSVVLVHEGCAPDMGLTCVITDDEHIQELNRQYRGVDEPTDVLAFSATEGTEFITPDDQPPYLGDIIISLPTAIRQASEAGHPLEGELALLAVHGCLHLIGYDHADDIERARMWQVQGEILRQLELAD